ncbi:MAG: prepilin-type N-terminal cleavage/methylation domain-containing protein [Acidobacteriota bacterium]|jgi:prepilin-type N-terminal cleavage/methylation domain-containing protein|nr:prepilin-type N-terminal cleavage/methylation domain-containing protein [Acidobacteriota bacterium]
MKSLKSVLKDSVIMGQKGFTLLELLVVVAILAAIAGTAAIALQDTDARASAAAHVAMMDELNKGVATYRVLHKNVYPDNFDSLAYVNDASTDTAVNGVLLPQEDDASAGANGDILGFSVDDIALGTLIAGAEDSLADIGITKLRYVNAAFDNTDLPELTPTENCDPAGGALQKVISSRRNNIVAGNIFNGPAANGCGASLDIVAGAQVAYWVGSLERVLGPGEYGDAAFSGTAMASNSSVPAGVTAPILMAVGFGPASDLFKPEILGSMTSVPVYRHVREDQYNRFIGLFRVGEATTTGSDVWAAPTTTEQVLFVGVVDGAGDTKEEELGEWDGTRSTI